MPFSNIGSKWCKQDCFDMFIHKKCVLLCKCEINSKKWDHMKKEKESMMWITLLLGGVEVCSPKKFMASEVASGGFLGPRRLVADMLK